MREPIRLLTVLAILMTGLFGLKTLSVFTGATNWWAAQAATFQDEVATVDGEDGETPGLTSEDGLPDLYEEPQVCETSTRSVAFGQELASRGLTPDEEDVLRSLFERNRLLSDRAAELETREALALAIEQRVDTRVALLEELEGRINTLVGELGERQAVDMESVVAWYAAMDAGDAAERIAQLAPDYQVQIASRMSRRSFGPILAEMEIPAAANLTQWMAERSDLPETASELEARVAQDS
jgi:flagellar motility protein MotE (MotC chaperone)